MAFIMPCAKYSSPPSAMRAASASAPPYERAHPRPGRPRPISKEAVSVASGHTQALADGGALEGRYITPSRAGDHRGSRNRNRPAHIGTLACVPPGGII
ncbi:hypothetical protein C8Q79DRAFT_378298 [Trametes meyenii]|nr:hypothetical protein C8Q79DRAFT_378298 [Trametes meyenii]